MIFKKILHGVFLFFVILSGFGMPLALLHAADSEVGSVLKTAKAIVDIQSVNAAVVSGQPQGFFDKSTGQILVARKIRQVEYDRSGSGVIIDPRGIIVTNAHTIRGAGDLVISLFDGTRAPVREAYLVPGTDIAFLSVAPPFALESIPFADTETVAAGANVYSIGHSEWLKGAILGGKLLNVQKEMIAGVSHVTALELSFDMKKGDSGCPVLNDRGELLGIVGAGTPGPASVTFAIPSNAIADAYKEYLKTVGKA